MKIVYQNVIWLLFLASYNHVSSADVEVDVAAFFHQQESQAQIAFEAAIYNFNIMESRESLISFTAKSQVVPESDSFENSNLLCNLTEDNKIGGIFTVGSSKTSSVVKSFSENLEIPNICVEWQSSTQQKNNFSINVYPYTKLLYQGLGVIVKHLQWRSIVIFYETTENLIRLQDILKVQNYDESIKFNSVIVKELGPGPDYRSALKQIQNKSEHRIVLDCKTENTLAILQQAKELRLLEKQFSYFLTSLDAHTLDLGELDAEANITTVRIINPESDNFFHVFTKWLKYAQRNRTPLTPDFYSVLTEAALMHDAASVYMSCARDLRVTNTIDGPQSLSCRDIKRDLNFGFSLSSFMKKRRFDGGGPDTITGPMAFDDFGKRIDFNIHVVEGNRENVVATWNAKKPKLLEFMKSEEDRNKELEKKWSQGSVTVASIFGKPYLTPKKQAEGEVLQGDARYEGFSVDLIKELAAELKIKTHFEVLDTPARGNYNKETKSWDGLIREILERRAELAICDFTITPERREVVDFSTPFMQIGISILYKQPEPKQGNMYAFLQPLSVELWFCSATLYLGITVVLWFISRLSPTDWENPHPCDQEPEELENIWHIKNCLWLTLGSVMNQGCDIVPKGISTRMAISMWWFFAIIVTNSYMANLAAFLTTTRSSNDIKNAEDLVQQTKVQYGTMEGGSTQAFFRETNYSTYQRMWTNMQQAKPSVFEKSNDDGVTRVKNTKNRLYAFLMESASLEYQIYTQCDLMQVDGWLDSKSYGIAMPLDYPHRSRINEALLTLQEKGRISVLKDRWWKEKRDKRPCVDEPETVNANRLALENVGGVFVVLAMGIGLAYIVAICEFLWNVRNVSVEEHLSFKEALIIETKFALNVMVTKKKVKRQATLSSRSSSKSRNSIGFSPSVLQSAGSFLHLGSLNRGETPGSSRHSSRPLN